MRRTVPASERFWKYVDKNGPTVAEMPTNCWVWIGAKNEHGYGVIGKGGRGSGSLKAHRLSWEMQFGPAPEGHGVLHKCDNPACVRPDHLFTGDQKVNLDDCRRKGRKKVATGEGNGRHKLSDRDRSEMRGLYGDGIGYRKLGKLFGVHRATARYVVTGKGSYAHQVAARKRRQESTGSDGKPVREMVLEAIELDQEGGDRG
jgi:hypothetical protein